jgi:proton glutamate symport protein
MALKERLARFLTILKNPIVILFSIGIAILLGIVGSKGNIGADPGHRTFSDWTNIIVTFCMPFGNMYLNLLKMTVYPILIAAIVSSIAGLVKSPHIGKFLSRMLIYFMIMLVFTSVLGTVTGLIGQPGANLSNEAKSTLGKSIEKSEYKVDMEISLSQEQAKSKDKINFIEFLINIVPENVFKSLTDEMALQLVFFSILFGIAIGMIQGNKSDFIITLFEGLFKAFQKIINWLMYLLPFGLIFLLAGQIASSQKFFEVLIAMVKFIVLFYIAGMISLLINTVIIWKRSNESLVTVLKETLDPVIIALATRSSFATLPAAIKSLDQKLRFYESTTKLYIPLGITLGRFGNILYFALAALFVSQLYGAPVTVSGLFIIVIASIFAGTATAGATGLATLSLLSIVLSPLGLPVEAVLILFMTIDTIIDPMRTLLIVHTNMAVNALIADKSPEGDRRKEFRSQDEIIPSSLFIEDITGRGSITVAIRKNDVPLFHYKNQNGVMDGIDIQMANMVAKSLKVKLNVNMEAESEDDMVDLLDSGEADFAISRINANSRISDRVVFTKPYLNFHKAILLNREQTKGKNARELIASYNGEIGILKGSPLLVSSNKIFPNAHAMEYSNYSELSEAVANGEILAGFGNELDFRYALLKNQSFQSRVSLAVLKNTEDNYAMAIASKNGQCSYIFNNVISDDLSLSAEQFIIKYDNV